MSHSAWTITGNNQAAIFARGGGSLLVVGMFLLVFGGRSLTAARAQEPAPRENAKSPSENAVALKAPSAEALLQAGVRVVESEHLTLYTDVPASPIVDGLGKIFDQAVPQWGRFFDLPQSKTEKWRVIGILAKNRSRFEKLDLWPADLPRFPNGYSRRGVFWFYEQTSDYYRRHLMLHEGTHLFMEHFFGSIGPPWYAEGMAELLGTHRLENGRLTIGIIPASREETPYWGRVKLIKDAIAEERRLSLMDVLNLGAQAHLENEAYGWSWGVAAFFHGNEEYQKPFLAMKTSLTAPNFNDRFLSILGKEASQPMAEWELYLDEIDYGHDFARSRIAWKKADAITRGKAQATISADRGWQASGYRVEKGKSYRVTGAGRYQLTASPKIWWCEPNGVSIHYHQGKPLGVLLAVVVPDDARKIAGGTTTWTKPSAIGLDGRIEPSETGSLLFKINEASKSLSDNKGTLAVKIEEVP